MSGYKRVNFYELCRLCATNQLKDKTHIFQEEGRKIQLQSKIQSCLSINVQETDCLPKVVCSKCLRSLEVCYSFRQECANSETMLSSYFKNFRTTEDFKRSGEVYIKDTAPNKTNIQSSNDAVAASPSEGKRVENLRCYTLQVAGNAKNPAAYQPPKQCDSNVVVNNNGEVLNIAQLVDFESLMGQSQKLKPGKLFANKRQPTFDTGQKVAAKPLKHTPIKIEDTGYKPDYYATYGNVYPSTVEPSTVNLNAISQDVQRSYPTNQEKRTNDDVKAHSCEICRKSFKRREHLYQHVKLHTGFRPYTCESCSKAFMRKEHLLRHMTSHSGLKNYSCDVCEKSFSRNDNLLKHRKTHERQASYTCEVCDKQFVMKHYYQAHKLTHDGNEVLVNRSNLAAAVFNALKT